ncbi:MAG: hypothetical protein NXI23_21685 [Bacteroidetes bacterium]|jgi:large subunit ribosomal protein L27|nr:hypothetical protein [Bacteroidota bacterium]
MATKTVKKNKVTRIENIKATVTEMNKKAAVFTDSLVEETIATGTEWQKILAKAIKNGTILLNEQQDLTFDTLEGVKGQILKGNKRFRKLFTFDFPKNKPAKKAAPTTAKKAVENLDAKTRVDKVAKKVAKADATVKSTKKVTPKKAISKKNVTKSNLKVIEGIGPKLETILNEGGIFTFDQLAKATPASVKAILEAAGPRYKMHVPTTWAKQATLASAGKMEELKALQAELKAGKAVKK